MPRRPKNLSKTSSEDMRATSGRTTLMRKRSRLLSVQLRAGVWKVVKLLGTEFLKGFANKIGGTAAMVLCILGIAYMLGIDPGNAVRAILGI